MFKHKVKVKNCAPLLGAGHEIFVSTKALISPEIETSSPQCPSWGNIFRIRSRSTTL